MVLVGATGRNAGKTTAAVLLIAALQGSAEEEALKVTTADHSGDAVCHRGGEGCGACFFREPFLLEEELDPSSGKDTSRLLAAGAERVFWLRATPSTLAEGLAAYLASVPPGRLIVAESNSLRTVVRPGCFIMAKDPSGTLKPSAETVASLADLEIGGKPHALGCQPRVNNVLRMQIIEGVCQSVYRLQQLRRKTAVLSKRERSELLQNDRVGVW
jgi:hypothetical protein